MNVKQELLRILHEICPGIDFTKETALIDNGILESLDIVTIVAELMDTFDIELNVEDLLPENFNSVEDMLKLIDSRR